MITTIETKTGSYEVTKETSIGDLAILIGMTVGGGLIRGDQIKCAEESLCCLAKAANIDEKEIYQACTW